MEVQQNIEKYYFQKSSRNVFKERFNKNIIEARWRALRRKASTLYVVGGESPYNLTAATDPNNFL